MILEAKKLWRRKIIHKHFIKKYPCVGPDAVIYSSYDDEVKNPLKYTRVDPLIILMQCPKDI